MGENNCSEKKVLPLGILGWTQILPISLHILGQPSSFHAQNRTNASQARTAPPTPTRCMGLLKGHRCD